ncbi:alpha/beta fold hydrolase [Phenylobacterium sp.]|jgi:pimeloyl-ACP methyl ester carboxylesterase|uniref:alpha/beta fold hydrolase n=1 Tax=Phenylobacterium sp. TaxID=1871053 RepID=UPI002F9478E8
MGLDTARSALPIVFDRCAGWLHQAPADVGVLMLSPWGFEELSMRRSWRMLADALARAGYPCLRFDYPGTGDSAGEPRDIAAVDTLTAAAVRAAEELRRLGGVRRLVVLGQGLGAAVATLAASQIEANGLALLAPVSRGREHLRELSVWGAMVAETLGFTPEPGSVAGFEFPQELTDSLRTLDLTQLARAPSAVLVVGRKSEVRLADHLRGLGAKVTEIAYEGYEAAVGNPTAARPPVATIEVVTAWVGDNFPTAPAPEAQLPAPAVLAGDGFTEEHVQFGPGRRLFGVLCEPQGPRTGATVLMLSAGGDPHAGWARSGVDQARALARAGVASFRMDAADVGDSDGPLSAEPPRLYDGAHIDDAIMAVDLLETRGFGPVLPLGRCSGAFVAFNAAVRDERLRDLVLVNQRRFVWDRDGKVELASDQVDHYRRQAKDPKKLLARVLKGEVNLVAVAVKLGRSGLAVVMGLLGGHGRKLDGAAKAAFQTLKQRNVRVTLLYSRDGDGHRDFAGYFGEDGRRLRRCADLELIYLDDADHGLTPRHAREALLSLVTERALWPPAAPGSVAAGDASARQEDLALRPGVGGGALPAH